MDTALIQYRLSDHVLLDVRLHTKWSFWKLEMECISLMLLARSFWDNKIAVKSDWAFLVVKMPTAMQEMQVRSLCQEEALEKEEASHSSILAWKTHGQRSLVGYGLWGHRVRHDLAAEQKQQQKSDWIDPWRGGKATSCSQGAQVQMQDLLLLSCVMLAKLLNLSDKALCTVPGTSVHPITISLL